MRKNVETRQIYVHLSESVTASEPRIDDGLEKMAPGGNKAAN